MKQFRLVLNGVAGEWINAENVTLETLHRTGQELNNLGYKEWYLEWKDTK